MVDLTLDEHINALENFFDLNPYDKEDEVHRILKQALDDLKEQKEVYYE